ncbi:unnamed protein product [Sympodiomycopsis kandeliae]
MASTTTDHAAAEAGPSKAVNGSKSQLNGKSNNTNQRLSKNAKRRAKKKQEKTEEGDAEEKPPAPSTSTTSSLEQAPSSSVPSTSALVQEFQSDVSPDDDAFEQFKEVFAKFQGGLEGDLMQAGAGGSSSKGQVIYSDDEAMSDSDATRSDGEDGMRMGDLSKRRQKKLSRLTVAELKQIVRKPEVVDWSDVTATDPKLLVAMKSARNTVPVPPHWSQKREYLQNKRGIEKAPYELPSYIADTGIGTMKDALREKEAEQSLRTKTRERVQPKMGKIGADYEKLYAAFFKFQTKPPLSGYGETYYEGKEYEHKFKERQPGDLSIELKEALSIPPLAPPPWLIAMQRFGPPPSYPHLKIPGLNAPIPNGAQWGFHPGGWGRPPVDEQGQPLYGDVMGYGEGSEQQQHELYLAAEEATQRDLFGELESEEEEEEEESEEEEEESEEEEEEPEEEEEEPAAIGNDGPADGLETPGGLASVTSTVPGGLETPDFLELRKQGRGGTSTPHDVRPESSSNRSLYQVIPERQAAMQGFMGSERGYDLPSNSVPVLGTESESRGTKRKSTSSVEVSFDPSELENMSESELQHKYDELKQKEKQNSTLGKGSLDTSGQDLNILREELSRKRQQQEERRRERGNEGKGFRF